MENLIMQELSEHGFLKQECGGRVSMRKETMATAVEFGFSKSGLVMLVEFEGVKLRPRVFRYSAVSYGHGHMFLANGEGRYRLNLKTLGLGKEVEHDHA